MKKTTQNSKPNQTQQKTLTNTKAKQNTVIQSKPPLKNQVGITISSSKPQQASKFNNTLKGFNSISNSKSTVMKKSPAPQIRSASNTRQQPLKSGIQLNKNTGKSSPALMNSTISNKVSNIKENESLLLKEKDEKLILLHKELLIEKEKLKEKEKELEEEKKIRNEIEIQKELEKEELLIKEREFERNKQKEIDEEKEILFKLEREAKEEKENFMREKEKLRAIEKIREQERLKILEEENRKNEKEEEIKKYEDKIIAEEIRKAEEREREIIREIERVRQRELMKEREFNKIIEREEEIEKELIEMKKRKDEEKLMLLLKKERELEDEIEKIVERTLLKRENKEKENYELTNQYKNKEFIKEEISDNEEKEMKEMTREFKIDNKSIESEEKEDDDGIGNDNDYYMIDDNMNLYINEDNKNKNKKRESKGINTETILSEVNNNKPIENINLTEFVLSDKHINTEENNKQQSEINTNINKDPSLNPIDYKRFNNYLIDDKSNKDILNILNTLKSNSNFNKFLKKMKQFSNKSDLIKVDTLINSQYEQHKKSTKYNQSIKNLHHDSNLLMNDPYLQTDYFSEEIQSKISLSFNINPYIKMNKKALLHKDEIINSLENRLESKNEEIKVLEEIITDLKSDIVKLNKANAVFMNEVEDKDLEIKVLSEEKKLIEKKYNGIISKNTFLKEEIEFMTKRNAENEEMISQINEEKRKLELKYNQIKNQLDEEEIEKEKMRSEIILIKTENNKKTEKISDLQKRLIDIEQDGIELRLKTQMMTIGSYAIKEGEGLFNNLKNEYMEMKNQYELLSIKNQVLIEENFSLKKECLLYKNENKLKEESIQRVINENLELRRDNKKKIYRKDYENKENRHDTNENVYISNNEYENDNDNYILNSSSGYNTNINKSKKKVQLILNNQQSFKSLKNKNENNENKTYNDKNINSNNKTKLKNRSISKSTSKEKESIFGINPSETMSNFKPIDKLKIIRKEKIDEIQLILDGLNMKKSKLEGEIGRLHQFPKSKSQIETRNQLEMEFNQILLDIGIAKKQMRDVNTATKVF